MIGFDAAVAATAPGRYEFELEAALNAGYRRHGADGASAFPPIIASGDNATTLHYESNDSPLPPNGMVLMDVGASYHDYAADFTRTIPVSGRFNERPARVLSGGARRTARRRIGGQDARARSNPSSDSATRTLAAGLAQARADRVT